MEKLIIKTANSLVQYDDPVTTLPEALTVIISEHLHCDSTKIYDYINENLKP